MFVNDSPLRRWEQVIVVKKKLTELKKPEKNVRTHTEDQIKEFKRSVQMFGQIRPIVIDENNVMLAGNGLYDTLVELGYKEADCYVVVGLSEAEKKKLMIADNKIFDLGANDIDAFDSIIKELGTDLDIPGYDSEMLSMFVDDLLALDEEDPIDEEEDSPSSDEQEIEADVEADEEDAIQPTNHKSKPGQVYQLGRHRLMCGDSTNISDVMKLMDGAKAQLLLTDPPYNVNYEGTAGTIENDNMEEKAFYNFLYKAFKAADFAMKAGASFYIWHADSHGLTFRKACQKVDWEVRQCLIWVKNSFVLGRQDYQWQHEPCLYGWKDGTHLWTGNRKQTTVFEYDKPKHNDAHPTMKPVKLFEKQMLNSTNPGDIVLDLFSGSGTTLIAAEQNNRAAYCMEFEPKFVDVIIDRWEIMTGKQAVLVTE